MDQRQDRCDLLIGSANVIINCGSLRIATHIERWLLSLLLERLELFALIARWIRWCTYHGLQSHELFKTVLHAREFSLDHTDNFSETLEHLLVTLLHLLSDLLSHWDSHDCILGLNKILVDIQDIAAEVI